MACARDSTLYRRRSPALEPRRCRRPSAAARLRQLRKLADRQFEELVGADLKRRLLHLRRHQDAHDLEEGFADQLMRLPHQRQGRAGWLRTAVIAGDRRQAPPGPAQARSGRGPRYCGARVLRALVRFRCGGCRLFFKRRARIDKPLILSTSAGRVLQTGRTALHCRRPRGCGQGRS